MRESIRALVRERAFACCEYCQAQAKFSHDSFSVEHVIPLSKGGSDNPVNLAWSCQGCNNFKYTAITAYDMVTAEIVNLFHPRLDRWNIHFAWNTDFSKVIGLTPTGRATQDKLQLNRNGLVNLRAVLTAAGHHPPLHTLSGI
jgi:hypothetical protein